MKKWVRLEEVGLLAVWIFLFTRLSVSPWWMALMLVGPDIGMLGYVAGTKIGALTYNLIHHRVIAVVLYLLGFSLGSEIPQIVGSFWDTRVWTASSGTG